MRVTAIGLVEAIESLDQMHDRVRDMRPAYEACASLMDRAVDERFSTGTDFDGAPWAPLAPATVKRRRNATGGTLERGGLLHSRTVVVGLKDGVLAKTEVPYAGVQYFGSPSRNQPGRQWFPVRADGTLAMDPGTPGGDLALSMSETIAAWVELGEV